MSQVLNVAVIDVGHLKKWHTRRYAASDDSRLVSVADADLKSAHTIAGEHGAEAGTDNQAILDAEDVIGEGTTNVHTRVAKDSLFGGEHCLIETRVLIDMEKAHNAVSQPALTERCNSVAMDIDEPLGQPQLIESTRPAPFTARATGASVMPKLMIHNDE
jgi:hypothetical protein